MRHLPRIVSILDGQTEPKNLVRSVFSSIVTTPSQAFGSVTSNLPRVRQSELLTPVELMVMLHESEKEIGLKSAIEGVYIFFFNTSPEVDTVSHWDLLLDDRCVSIRDPGFRHATNCRRARAPSSISPDGLFVYFDVPLSTSTDDIVGDTSCNNLQIARRFRFANITATACHEKGLDESSTLGRLHPLRQSHCPGQLWCSAPAPQRTAPRSSR
jgi:Symplekin tight junction protein C terminal